MSGGFRVDLGALAEAFQGIDGVLYDVGNNQVSDIKVDQSAVGHDRLASSISSFCDVGREQPRQGQRGGRRPVAANVAAYDKAEKAMSGVFSGTNDPADS